MIRLSKAFERHTTYATTCVSLIALIACGGDGDDAAPETGTPGLQGSAGQTTNPPGTAGAGTTPVGTTPPGEENPTDAPLDPTGAGGSGTGNPPATEPAPFAEDTSADCVVPELPTAADLQDIATLPDPFLGLNGERITTKAQWRCRRQEIKKVAERFVYGEKPPKPESVTGTVSDTGITVNVETPGGSASFSVTVTMPPGATGPVPAIIGYGGSSFQDAILQDGVAFINYNVGDVGDETTNNPKVGAFYTVNPDRQDTGMLVAWAWGVSRILDVIEASDGQIIDAQGIGVHGCSRSGKGAFIAGAFDERVALTLPYESGMAGVPAFRFIVREGGEVLRNAIEYRPWAGEAYRQFLVLGAPQTDAAALDAQNQTSGQMQTRLPIDTHEVIGMVAPRGLLVMGNPGIVNLAPDSEKITVLAGTEIYSALGAAENISYTSNTANGNHCSFREEFVPLLQQNMRKFLKKDATATTGSIDPDPRLPGELGPNIAWETPTLE
jgi:hypothetical protein